jgi:hypothetical protein
VVMSVFMCSSGVIAAPFGLLHWYEESAWPETTHSSEVFRAVRQPSVGQEGGRANVCDI